MRAFEESPKHCAEFEGFPMLRRVSLYHMNKLFQIILSHLDAKVYS